MIKLLLLADKRDAFGEWGQRSIYAKDLLRVFRNTKTDIFAELYKEMSRYYSLNFIKGNHIEIRCFGGEGYHTKEQRSRIVGSVSDFLPIYKSACSPEQDKLLYLELLSEKKAADAARKNEVTADEVCGLFRELTANYGYDADVAIAMALDLYEEERLVPREKITKELEDGEEQLSRYRFG